MNRDAEEKRLRDIAARFAQAYGEDLKKEAEALDAPPDPRLYARIQRRIRARRRLVGGSVAAIAAGLLVFFALRLLMPFAAGGPPQAAAIPLAFALPQGFAVAAVEQDRGQTIYTLENQALDDVVLTLEYADEPMDVEEFTPLTLGGKTIYALSRADYKALVYEEEGLLTKLTCRYDVNTLVDFYRATME